MVFPIGLNYAYPYCWKCHERHSMFVECKTRKAGDSVGPVLQRVERDSPSLGDKHELFDGSRSGSTYPRD